MKSQYTLFLRSHTKILSTTLIRIKKTPKKIQNSITENPNQIHTSSDTIDCNYNTSKKKKKLHKEGEQVPASCRTIHNSRSKVKKRQNEGEEIE